MTIEDIVGYETMLAVTPQDGELHDDVALLYLQVNRPLQALAHFRASAQIKPDSPQAKFNLGTALAAAGNLAEAETSLREALKLRPSYASAHNNLGGVLLSLGKLEDAIVHLREALRLDPSNTQAANNLLEAQAALKKKP
jgi:Flp pilus assembly protein TadD